MSPGAATKQQPACCPHALPVSDFGNGVWQIDRLQWVGTVISLGGEAAVQVVPPPDCDPLSALLRSAAVQASSDGQTECQLVKANREQACQPV